MDSHIIIDDDFTVDVVEEDEELAFKDVQIKSEPEWDVESNTEYEVANDVNIKQECEIDIEENYLFVDKFVDFTEIKTEIEDSPDDTVLPTLENIANDVLAATEPTDEQSKLVSESTPNMTSRDENNPAKKSQNEKSQSLTKPSIEPLDKRKLQQNKKENRQQLTPTDEQSKLIPESTPNMTSRDENTPAKKSQNEKSKSLTKPSKEPLDKRKLRQNKKENRQQLAKAPSRHHSRKRNRNGAKFKFWNRNKRHRNYRFNKYNNHNTFQNCPPRFDAAQTYNTILCALNQILQVNQNGYENRETRFSQSYYKVGNRPQVWVNDRANTPSFECSARLQTYTTLLQAVSQLNSGVATQNTMFTNNLRLEMSFSNVFRSF